MNGNIKIEDIDRILLGIDALLIVLTRMTETSDLIRAGGEDGISDADLAMVKERASNSFAQFNELVSQLESK